LINKALRSEDLDQLYTFRFFIGDLSRSLEREHQKILLSDEQALTVYRGRKLDQEEFDKLKENEGKLISTNGYLSTSRLRSRALTFAMKPTRRVDVISVLFQIEYNVKQLGKSVIFADIAQFSEYPKEEEVLFDLNACFRLESIREDGSVQIIKMIASNEGQTITKDYMKETQHETDEKSVMIVFGRLMCNLGQYDKSQKYFEQLLDNPHGEDLACIEFNIGRALHYKGEWKIAREYYDRAHHRMMNDKPPRINDSAHVLNNIGCILDYQRKYGEALDYYRQALAMREKYYPSGHVDTAQSLNNIGVVLYNQEKYDEAFDYHQLSLKMREEYCPYGHVDIASSLNNIGGILHQQEKYDEALDYYQRSLKMCEKYYPFSHIIVGDSLNNIGAVYKN
jgi:tetratricopeptide (TPR) repeat protein